VTGRELKITGVVRPASGKIILFAPDRIKNLGEHPFKTQDGRYQPSILMNFARGSDGLALFHH
jgi:hypothetical protein